MCIAEWCEKRKVTGTLRLVLENACSDEFGFEADEQRVLNLLLMLSTAPGSFALFGKKEERFHIVEGNASFGPIFHGRKSQAGQYESRTNPQLV